MAEAVDVERTLAEDNKKLSQPESATRPESTEKEEATELTSSNGSPTEKLETATDEGNKPNPSKVKELWGKLGLDVGTVLIMFKGSIAPIIAVAWFQSTAIADIYTTIGYLIPIICVLSLAIMPRAKFIQTLLLNLVGTCVGAAMALLGIWSAVQARKHTTPAGSMEAYNSSQAAVCAIWLFSNIYFVNVMRAKIPALQFPVIIYSIFTNVAFTYGPLFQTTDQAEAFVRKLLISFLTAFGLSTGVSLFIIPISSRTVVQKEQTGYLQGIRGALKAQTTYLLSLEKSDMFAANATTPDEHKRKKEKKKLTAATAETPEAKALKGAIAGLIGLHGKLNGDMPFGKRETAWGKLDANDLDEITKLFRSILIPLVGMSTITDIFERIAERRGWVKAERSSFDRAEAWEHSGEDSKLEEKKVWNEVMKSLHNSFAVAASAMDEGMEHAGLVLELLPKPSKKKSEDEEAKGGDPKPGDGGFGKHIEKKMLDFYKNRGETLKAWAREKGLTEDMFDAGTPTSKTMDSVLNEGQHRRDQQQLYLILYMEHLLYATGIAVANFVKFADSKVTDGTMQRNRLIVPGQRRLKKWILGLGSEDATIDTETPDSLESGSSTVYMGSGFNKPKDPEHLPPQTVWQHCGNRIRIIPRFLRSTESAFGFRVACATLTIGIVAFLKDTQKFFIEQRLVWAMIIIAIGMTMTSGQSMFGFFGRIAGTFLAAVSSIIIWYIVDQKTPGVIVFLWLFIFLEMYFFLKVPRFLVVWLITIVTQVLIIGYELQVHKIGVAAASASGQPYYPVYELAPYRLACVAGGSFVAFVWTIFPYPLSDRSWLRKDLGTTLYLLANYYSVVHSTIGARMHGTEGDMDSSDSPGRKLEKVRHKIFNKLLMLLPSLRSHADWQKWELTVGGKFPRETYENIITRATNIMHYLTLITFATRTWSSDSDIQYPNTDVASRRKWLNDLTAVIDSINPTTQQITSILSLLSASVREGFALPPYMQLPEPYNLNTRLEALDKGILDARHVKEPGYSAYACMQVASSMIVDDLARLIESVKDLVGETDFTFKVLPSESSLDINGSDESSGKGKKD